MTTYTSLGVTMSKLSRLRAVDPITIIWPHDDDNGVADCSRCHETVTGPSCDWLDQWADEHRCDPELVALLDAVTLRAA